MTDHDDPAAGERENARRLAFARTVFCRQLPGCPAEHHPDCPRHPARWSHALATAMTEYGEMSAEAAAAMMAATPDTPDDALRAALAPDPPKPMLAGTFALYETPRGGLVLVTETPEHGVVRRELSPAVVRAGLVLAGGGKMPKGGPAGLIRGLISRG